MVVEGIVGLRRRRCHRDHAAGICSGWLVWWCRNSVVPICCAGTVVSGAVVVASMGPDIAGSEIKQTS